MMKKGLKISLWMLLIVGVFFLLGFMHGIHNNMDCADLQIDIDYEDADPLIFTSDIQKTIYSNYDSLIGKKINDINALAIEETLNAMDLVSNAEVYSTLTGVLKVNVTQRTPLVRVMNKRSQSYYIGRNGHLMPVIPGFSSRTLVASGNIRTSFSDTLNAQHPVNKELFKIYALASYIQQDHFLHLQIEQVYLNDQNEFELIPKVGRHVILLGDVVDLKTKFDKLKLFYDKGIQKAGWDAYKSINLKFKNQVVCEKK